MAIKESKSAEGQEVVIAYKGFDKDLACHPEGGERVQYVVGETLELDGDIAACHRGFHACEYPLDVFGYYPPAGSRFALVEQSGQISRHDSNSKVASSKIKVSAEIGLPGIIKAAIEYTTSRAKPENSEHVTSRQGAASSTGNYGAASSTGDQGAASSTGYRGAASSTGDQGAASSTGNRGAASSTGYRGAASSTGNYGAASSTGDRGAASSTGNRGAASSTGDQGAASSTGTQGAAMASGYAGKVMGAEGNALFLVERDDEYKIVSVWAGIAGQDGIKAGAWYVLRDGKPVEV